MTKLSNDDNVDSIERVWANLRHVHIPNKDGYSLEIFYNFVREIISIS